MSTYDGLNIRKEFKRLCELECWHPKIRDKHPQLKVVFVKKGTVRTLGTARWYQHLIRLRIKPGQHTRYDLLETMVHEIAHIDAQWRENDRAFAEGRLRKHIAHEPEFWVSMDMGWAAAFPHAVEFVGPKLSNYHGRYTKALKEAEGVLPKPEPKPAPRVVRQVPGVIMWEERPAASVSGLAELLPGGARNPRVPKPRKYVTTHIVDEQVRQIVQDLVLSTRDEIQVRYEKQHGDYPGKSVYNSLWRLRRDEKVKRTGHDWTIA